MNLGELLEELREGILHDNSDQVAGGGVSQLWSDRRLVLYIDQAQRRMARQALMIRDKMPLETEALKREYPLDPSVVAVISVRAHGDLADLSRAGHALFDTYHTPDTYFFDPSSLSALPPGKMMSFDTDEQVAPDEDGSMGTMVLRVYPAPDAVHVQKLQMRVIRLPLNHLTLDDMKAVPEIPEEHHLDMLDWAAYLALRKVDVDAGNPELAAAFRASFEAHCKEARDIAMRKLFAVSAWGFGRNGFSWESN